MKKLLGTKRPYRIDIFISKHHIRIDVYSRKLFNILKHIPFLDVGYIFSREEEKETKLYKEIMKMRQKTNVKYKILRAMG